MSARGRVGVLPGPVQLHLDPAADNSQGQWQVGHDEAAFEDGTVAASGWGTNRSAHHAVVCHCL